MSVHSVKILSAVVFVLSTAPCNRSATAPHARPSSRASSGSSGGNALSPPMAAQTSSNSFAAQPVRSMPIAQYRKLPAAFCSAFRYVVTAASPDSTILP